MNREEKVLIIAEAGVNHNGNIELAKELAKCAKDSGADIVKYQTVDLDSLVSQSAEMAEYQKRNTQKKTSQKEMLAKLILENEEFIELKEYCDEIGIEFLSTPFDIKSIHFLNDIGLRFWKVPSGEITNYPYLLEVAKTKKPVILSTGMCSLEEVDSAICILRKNGAGNISLLHCTTDYPTPYEYVNLRAMETLRQRFGVEVGYSDHTKGTEVAIAAVAMGAKIIEKHFTLSREMEGPDHKASLEPNELKQMVESIRNIEKAMGDGIKKIQPNERQNMKIARKSIIANRNISKGEVLTEDNLTTKRPGDGISPMRWNEVIGTKAIRNFSEDELIEI